VATMVRSLRWHLLALLPPDVFVHTQYSIYQLMNPCKTIISLLELAVGVSMPSSLGSLSYFTGHAFSDKNLTSSVRIPGSVTG
jgi:hypothetical protein